MWAQYKKDFNMRRDLISSQQILEVNGQTRLDSNSSKFARIETKTRPDELKMSEAEQNTNAQTHSHAHGQRLRC